MEQLHETVRELQVIAAACGLAASDVLDDIADSFNKSNKLAALPHFSQNQLSDDWAPHREAWIKWWDIFLEEYSLKCVKKWIAKCGGSRDTQTMEKLWLQYFEPLWLIGCKVAKHTRVKGLKEGVSTVFSRHSENLSKSEHQDLQADLQAWVDWCDKWGEGAQLIIDKFKGKQRQAITQTLKDLREYDETSLLGKLKRLISG